jgi:hypothetical protein
VFFFEKKNQKTFSILGTHQNAMHRVLTCAGHAARMGASEWHALSDELQLLLAQQAMKRASFIIADQADLFAAQFASATLVDRGAADALRLFAVLLRETSAECLRPAGNA